MIAIMCLGGKRSDFALPRAAQFSWQHDARVQPGGTITLFDDGSDGPITTESQSRGLTLWVDESTRTARLARSYRHPRPVLASAMGSFQMLPYGHALVGWGTGGYVSWNGTTRTRRWRVLAGAGASSLRPVDTAAKKGFERSGSRAPTPTSRCRRSGAHGHVLGTSVVARAATAPGSS